LQSNSHFPNIFLSSHSTGAAAGVAGVAGLAGAVTAGLAAFFGRAASAGPEPNKLTAITAIDKVFKNLAIFDPLEFCGEF
jgi:hypothetical protein